MSDLQQEFSGPGVRAVLDCSAGRCSFDVALERPAWGRDGAALEVFHQPRSHSGLPVGPPTVVQCERLPLWSSVDGARWIGRAWLPRGLRPEVARACHYRLRPVRMDCTSPPPAAAEAE